MNDHDKQPHDLDRGGTQTGINSKSMVPPPPPEMWKREKKKNPKEVAGGGGWIRNWLDNKYS